MRHTAEWTADDGRTGRTEFTTRAKTPAGKIRAAENAARIQSLFETGETLFAHRFMRVVVRPA